MALINRSYSCPDFGANTVSTPPLYFNKSLRQEIRELILIKHESCPLYFEEPSLRWFPGCEESMYVTSGLRVTPTVRRCISAIVEEVNKKVFRRKKQQWLLEELVMLRRKLDEANDEIKKTNGGIHTHYGNEAESILRDQLDTFKRKCKAMSLELESWKSYVGNEKERLDCEYQNKRKILEEEYEKKYEELQKESDDLAKREEKYELQCKELNNEWERLFSWKKNNDLELEEREKEILKKLEEMKLIEEGKVRCLHSCGIENIKLPNEAGNIIGKEICNSQYFHFVLEFLPTGFHILHEVSIYLSAKCQWKHNSQGIYNKKFCNLMHMTRDGVPARVILYAPWPKETQIECYVLSLHHQKEVYNIIFSDLCEGFQQALKERSRLQVKCRCNNPSCKPDEEVHFASASLCRPGFLVCDKRREEYEIINGEAFETAVSCCSSSRITAASQNQKALEDGGMNSACEATSVMQCSVSVANHDALESRMEIHEVIKELNIEVFAKWKFMAAHLNLHHYISTIRMEHNSVAESFVALLSTWDKNESYPFTWGTLVTMLEHIGHKTLAKAITKKRVSL